MRLLISCLALVFNSIVVAQTSPKIVVGIVVDQMRQDYLYRYMNRFDEGGFKRLLKEGYHFKNAHYNYIPTTTAPGHASIYTGTTPSNHGIIGNSRYVRESGLSMYCVADSEANAVGGSSTAGKISPKNLKVSTITDELRLTSNFRSKVVGVSIKDRGSVLPAGHNPTGAYWFDSKTGNFMTSDYYDDELPEWVTAFNEKKLVSKYLNQSWETLRPIETYEASTADDVPYESEIKGRDHPPTFPYALSQLSRSKGFDAIRPTPWGNTIIVDFALATIVGESLGQDEFTDFLALSFSSTDYAGHAFAPNSIEIEDMYLRLDLDLRRLFEFLDTAFGNEFLVFLTADHGAAYNPQYMIDNKMPGGFVEEERIKNELNSKISKELGDGDWVSHFSQVIYLNHDWIAEKKLDIAEIQKKVKRLLLGFPEVFEAYTANDLSKRNSSNSTEALLENGFNAKLSGDLIVRFQPGYISGYTRGGTTHGSGFTYDTHIPLLFMGKRIPQGESVRKVAITDIAPTLSMLLNVSLPSSVTGVPLEELFEK